MNQENRFQSEYDEINLIDYLKIILKGKKLILALFLVGLIGALALTFFLPSRYIGTTTLEVGELEGKPLEKLNQLVEKINSDVYGRYPGIAVERPENTNLVKIKISSEDSKEIQESLEKLNKTILADHTDKINLKKSNLEKRIKDLEEDIEFLIPWGQQIADLKLEIYQLQQQLETFQPTEIIQEPIVSEKKPNLILNLILGGVLGIFIGIILASGKEWWEKNKGKL